MQIFKAYFKIIQKNIPTLLIYLVIFLGLAFITSFSGGGSKTENFTESRSRIALINKDEGAAFSKGLSEYIRQNANVKDIADDEESLKDALYFSEIDFILKIPEGFSTDFMSGKKNSLEEIKGTNQTSGIYMETLLNRFLNIANLYVTGLKNLSQTELLERTLADLSKETIVVTKSFNTGISRGTGIARFFNYASYAVINILILGIATFMVIFNRSLIKQRTACSPIKQSNVSGQMLLANLCLVLVLWGIVMASAFILFGSELLTLNGILWGLNLMIFSTVSLAISFLIGTIVKSKNIINPIATTLGLGLSFICGVFVPQSILGESILSVARFLPTYWFVRINEQIGAIKDFSNGTIESILTGFLIQIVFFVAIMVIALVIGKQRRVESLA